jgi:hypothetical protein
MASLKRPRGGSGDGESDGAMEVLNSVEEFQKLDNPELKDLSSLLIKFIKFSVDNTRLEKLEKDVIDLEEDVHHQKLEIANNTMNIAALEKKLNEKIDQLTKSIGEWEKKYIELEASHQNSLSSNNFLLQDRIDNDLIVRGFPVKPDIKSACENFLECFRLDMSVVESYYYFPYAAKAGKTSHNLIISFKDFNVKMEVLSRKKQLGRLLLKKIQPLMEPPDHDVFISYSNRLSKFNLHAIYHLNKAKDNKTIFNVRYHNLFFAVKETEKSPWLRISNPSELEKYITREVEG